MTLHEPCTTRPSRNRYYVHDRATTEARELTSYGWRNPRYLIVDRSTGAPADEASTRYAARQAAALLNATATEAR